jgi:predicted Rossmann fold nucleotide-binding protein DprA/Smf involved in DNA uptake
MIPGEAYDLDELARRSSIDPVTLLQRLLEHELAGIVQRIDGGRFVRFRGTC